MINRRYEVREIYITSRDGSIRDIIEEYKDGLDEFIKSAGEVSGMIGFDILDKYEAVALADKQELDREYYYNSVLKRYEYGLRLVYILEVYLDDDGDYFSSFIIGARVGVVDKYINEVRFGCLI